MSPPSALKDLEVYVRAKYPLILINSFEEQRVEAVCQQLAQRIKQPFYTWSSTRGLLSHAAGENKSASKGFSEPQQLLDFLIGESNSGLFLINFMHSYFKDVATVRRLKELARKVTSSRQSVFLLSPTSEYPPELEKDITVYDFPLPAQDEITSVLDSLAASAGAKVLGEGLRDRLSRAALGLTYTEVENVFAKAAVMGGMKLDESSLAVVNSEKRQVIRKSGIMTFCDASEKVDDVGGLENLKDWIKRRERAFTEEAKKFGLPAPKGVLLIGVPGCGKSLTAKAIAGAWQLPLLRLDMGALFNKYIGESEANIRRAILTAETISPVVLWIDEIEKGLSGLGSSSDGGTSSRVFGTFLSWMQDKTAPVFVVATANDVSKLPPEMLRKGRFDEIFFVDLPSLAERKHIFQIHIRRRGRDHSKFDLDRLANESDGFSGAEIDQSVVEGLFQAFDASHELQTEDISGALSRTVPLSKTAAERINELRAWCNGRAIMAGKEKA